MCGFIITNRKAVDINAANRFVRLRGPDHTSQVHRGPFTFVHNLLSITGAFTPQPTISDDHQVFCLFNGEIYNFQKFGDYDNDSLCLIPLYHQFGIDFIKHLDGEFAIVLLDFKSDLLIATTDCFATKPLWMALEGDQVGFASYASALTAMGFAQPEKISANTSLVFELNSLKLRDRRTVYEFDAAHQEKTDFNDWCLAFEESIYKRAVRNVRELLFIGLSSGYDSGAIACALLNQSVPFKAYTLLGRENCEVLNQRCQCLVPKAQVEILDDSPPRRNMAHDFILKHVEPFQYRIHSLSSDYNEYHLDLRDDHGAVSLSLLAHHAKQDGRRIYLSGQGADEIFADYGYNGHKIYPHSNFGGLFPQDLTTIFPWPSFYESSMLSYLAKEEYIAGAYGLEARYPYLDPKVIQEFLWLRVDLKNMRYKSVLDYYLTAKGFPFGRNQKFGF